MIIDFKNAASRYTPNSRNKSDGLELLANLPANSIKTAFFDPQYRGVLDKLRYGNEGSGRMKDRCNLPQMDEEKITSFIREIDRVLVPCGHLFLWVDKYHLLNDAAGWSNGTELNLVDMLTWDKERIGMGMRTRQRAEYIAIYQKAPKRVKGCWTLRNIPDVWAERVKKNHPHAKPIELQKALIKATTAEGDWVLDPASGGYSVLSACRELNRNFIGCDIVYGEDSDGVTA